MKLKSLFSVVVVASTMGVLTAAYSSDEAPVVDITQQTGSVAYNEPIVPAPSQSVQAPAPVAAGEAPEQNIVQQTALQPANTNGANANPAAAAAPAPIVDTSNMTDQQRIARLEQQANNLTRMNLPQQISDMQQKLQQLSGQLQEQQHDLKMLNQQQRSFYQDLDQRIKQLENMSSGDSENSNANTLSNSPAADQAAKAASADLGMQDSATYNKAFHLMTQKQYSKAAAGFSNYLSGFPNGRFVANAHYWLGEINLLQKHLGTASTQFNTVITSYPKSNKVADARLKLAIIHAAQGKMTEAKHEFSLIKRTYPNSTAAQLASIQLQQLAS